MSSKYVRTTIKSFIETNFTSQVLVDFSAEYRDLSKLLTDLSIGDEDSFLGIQFLPSDESPIGIMSNNSKGCYRESGVFMLHIISPIGPNSSHVDLILDTADTLLGLFRGATINGDILIESSSSANFDSSGTVNFDNGYEAATITINFYRNNNF